MEETAGHRVKAEAWQDTDMKVIKAVITISRHSASLDLAASIRVPWEQWFFWPAAESLGGLIRIDSQQSLAQRFRGSQVGAWDIHCSHVPSDAGAAGPGLHFRQPVTGHLASFSPSSRTWERSTFKLGSFHSLLLTLLHSCVSKTVTSPKRVLEVMNRLVKKFLFSLHSQDTGVFCSTEPSV